MQVLYLSDASLIRFHAELENKESAMEPACFASARSSGEMCLAFRFLSLNPEHGFKFCLGGSLTHSTGLHQTWFSSQWWWMKSLKLPRQFIHDLLTSSLQVVFIKQSIDTGTINSSVNCGQTEVSRFLLTQKHTHTHTHTLRLMWDSLLASHGRAGLLHWLVFFHPGKLMDDVCLV